MGALIQEGLGTFFVEFLIEQTGVEEGFLLNKAYMYNNIQFIGKKRNPETRGMSMANICWEDSYVGQIRKLVGHKRLIHPSVRAIIQDEKGRVLFINRRGHSRWGMPAGSMELDESIFETLKREVKEETGIDVINAKLIAIYSGPDKSIVNEFGDEYQMFEFLFLVDEWKGTILKETDESNNAEFFSLDKIPQGSNQFWDKHHKEVIEDLRNFKGQLILK
ncbi:NUDIX domain-containing protein [Neobacillus sp. SCS-31]|uniref:NUDIX domain-containing protein n=1 Tax=Neobacillus oceani TaxID=3115292 RepID=UPI0039057895